MSKTLSIEKYNLTQSQTLPIQFAQLEQLNLNGAGIDVGLAEHWVYVAAGSAEVNVCSFGCFTPDLQAMAAWLKRMCANESG